MLKQRLITAAVLLVVIAAFAHYLMGWDPIAESRARGSIDVAVEACRVGNSTLFAEKLLDARIAIKSAPRDRYWLLDAALNNKLHFAGCKAD
jgi:hypothetical protein